MQIINEPTAAAIAYGFQKTGGADKNVKRNVLVFDLGGGTFDVSLVTLGKDMFEVKAVSGDTHLGGGDFDNRLVNHFVSEFKLKHKVDITGNTRSLERLRAACERVKRALSSTTETAIEIDWLYEGIDFSSVISRARFEKLNMDLFKDCLKHVECCLRDAKMEKGDIDEIVLVGGSTRIPMVQKLLKDFFNGKELCTSLNPDEAVAYGAAIHAAVLSGVMLVDVTPLSLSVNLLGGELSVVIPRNTPIPTKMEKNLTVKVYQTIANIRVYEGESKIAKENNLLDSLLLFGITSAPKGTVGMTVCFEIDADGILTVTAHEKTSGSTSQIIITKHSGRLSKAKIGRLVEEAKVYDMDRKKVKTAKDNLVNYVSRAWFVLNYDSVDIKDAVKKDLVDAVEQTIQWRERNFELTVVPPFEQKLEELKSICNPVISKLH